jgi:hypothetical protein
MRRVLLVIESETTRDDTLALLRRQRMTKLVKLMRDCLDGIINLRAILFGSADAMDLSTALATDRQNVTSNALGALSDLLLSIYLRERGEQSTANRLVDDAFDIFHE